MRKQNKEPIQYNDVYSDAFFAPADPTTVQQTVKKSAKNCKKGSMQQKKSNNQMNG